MSTTKPSPVGPSSTYTEGPDRYIRFAEDILQVRLAATQKRILRSLAENKRTLVVSGNGPGKSFGVAIAVDAFMCTNTDATGLGTSGSYSQFIDGMWRPMKNLFEEAQERYRIPGKALTGQQPRLEIDDDWFFRVVSPRDPGELEGRHAEQTIVVIEEADKKYISEDHFSSSRSTVTSAEDRMLAVANPPEDETGVVYQKMQSDQWNVIQFSSFESHNVRVDAGELDDEHLPGLVDLPTIAEDWEEWHDDPWPQVLEAFPADDLGEPYPGANELTERVEQGELDRERLIEWLRPGFNIARTAHEERDDLAVDWYRRRAGIIPKDNASVRRPFYLDDVRQAKENTRPPDADQQAPLAIGIDPARKGGDSMPVIPLYESHVDIHRWNDTDHNDNYSKAREIIDPISQTPPIAIDAVGEGSGFADRMVDAYPDVSRFKAGEAPNSDVAEDQYYNKWTEGLIALGKRLSGLSIDGSGEEWVDLREELFAAARTIELERVERRSGDLVRATSKEDVKERLGRSPDHLDALVMAAWVASGAGKVSVNTDNATEEVPIF